MEVELVLQIVIRGEKDEPVCQSWGQLGPWAMTVTLYLKVILMVHLAQVTIPAQKLISPPECPQD